MKNSLKILTLVVLISLQTACLDWLLATGQMLGGNLGVSPADSVDLIDLDDDDAGLMQDGPMPLPVTMSKLDGIDPTRLVITSEPDTRAAQNGFLRTARADTEHCVAGESCLITVSGLTGAVRDPETTPYVLVYADDDVSAFASAASDGSFAAVELVVLLDDSGVTDEILIAGMTAADLSEGVATYPLYFVVTDSGVVEFTQTNTDGSLVTGVMTSDEDGNTYYAVAAADGTSDVWRQDASGSIPELIVQDATGTIIDIAVIDATQILVFFENGSAQYVEIQDGGARATPLAAVFRRALAAQQDQDRTTLDGLIIKDPVEIFDFSSYDFESASFLPYGDSGFIMNLAPAEASATHLLAAYVSLDGEDVRTLIPYDPEDPDMPLKASISLVDGYFYVVAELANTSDPDNPFLGDTVTEFSRIAISEDLDATFNDPWQNREVLFQNITSETIDVDIRDGVLVFSDLTPSNTIRIVQWKESKPVELRVLWSPADFLSEILGATTDTSSVTDYSVTLSGGVVMAPNGQFFVACAYAEAPEGDDTDPDYLAALAKGAHLFVHRIDVDEAGEFHKILDNVAVESCPNGMEITDGYRLRYFSLETDDVPSQMKFVDLHDFEILTDVLE